MLENNFSASANAPLEILPLSYARSLEIIYWNASRYIIPTHISVEIRQRDITLHSAPFWKSPTRRRCCAKTSLISLRRLSGKRSKRVLDAWRGKATCRHTLAYPSAEASIAVCLYDRTSHQRHTQIVVERLWDGAWSGLLHSHLHREDRDRSDTPISHEALELCGEWGKGLVFKGLTRAMTHHP